MRCRPTSCALTARQSPKSDCRLATTRAYARTIGLRIRISRHDGGSERCSVSNHPDQLNASCPFTPPSKTLSTSSAIPHPAARSASCETKRSGRGEPPPRPELQPAFQTSLRRNQVCVTTPLSQIRGSSLRTRLMRPASLSDGYSRCGAGQQVYGIVLRVKADQRRRAGHPRGRRGTSFCRRLLRPYTSPFVTLAVRRRHLILFCAGSVRRPVRREVP